MPVQTVRNRNVKKRQWEKCFESGEGDLKNDPFDKFSANSNKRGVLSMHSQEVTQSGSTNVMRSSGVPTRQLYREQNVLYRDQNMGGVVKKGSTIQFANANFNPPPEQ